VSVRIAMFGHGWWARKYLVPGLRGVPGAELVAVCGRDEARTRTAAADLGVEAAFTDVAAMLDETAADGLMVVSTPAARPAAIRAAATRGIPVFCEKPLARNAAETAALVESCASIATVVGFTQRWHPGLRTAARLLDDGAIGGLRHLRYTTASCFAADASAPWDWRSDPAEYAYGILSDLGPHAVDVVHWLAGEITEVTATARTVFDERDRRPVGNWDDCTVTARTDTGVPAVLALTRVLPASPYRRFEHRLELIGDGGTVAYDSGRPAEVVLAPAGDRPRVVPADGLRLGDLPAGSFEEFMAVSDHAATAEMADVVAVFRGAAVPQAPTVADGHRGQLVLDAAARSAAEWKGERV
jgi:predicted dehydrogenase